MGKFYGKVGYEITTQTSKGVWEGQITEKLYSGDIIRNQSQNISGEGLNNDIRINNEISILADPFAYANFYNIKYVEWMGALWIVTNVTVVEPRLILSIGGHYAGPESKTTTP